jgi:hypothetical protein
MGVNPEGDVYYSPIFAWKQERAQHFLANVDNWLSLLHKLSIPTLGDSYNLES